MFIYKCDMCKKEIKDRESKVAISYGLSLSNGQLCHKCGKPVIDFLRKSRLIDDEGKFQSAREKLRALGGGGRRK